MQQRIDVWTNFHRLARQQKTNSDLAIDDPAVQQLQITLDINDPGLAPVSVPKKGDPAILATWPSPAAAPAPPTSVANSAGRRHIPRRGQGAPLHLLVQSALAHKRGEVLVRSVRLNPVFVETMPDTLEEGVLYASMQYAMTIHRCACGCGHEVVAPLAPTSWIMTFDSVNVSLDPSIGNWSFPCRSHYWVRRGRIQWAGVMSQEDINEGRRLDSILRSVETESLVVSAPNVVEQPVEAVEAGPESESAKNWWQLLGDRWKRWWKY
jgi:hypothetical protein